MRRRAAPDLVRDEWDVAAPDLVRDEWDFSDCPDAEIWDCHAYEFAREIQVIRDDVDSLRKNLPCTFEALVNALRSRIQSTPRAMALFWYCPEFPNGPYLKIPVVERKRRSNALWPPATIATVVTAKIIPPDIGQRLASGRVFYGSEELALFRLNWTESDKFLALAFSEWLKEHRPTDVKLFETRGAGNVWRQQADDLKALGALRLLKKMKWDDAFTLTHEVLGKERARGSGRKRVALYTGREEVWIKAAKRAEKIIAALSHPYISNRLD